MREERIRDPEDGEKVSASAGGEGGGQQSLGRAQDAEEVEEPQRRQPPEPGSGWRRSGGRRRLGSFLGFFLGGAQDDSVAESQRRQAWRRLGSDDRLFSF